MYKAIPPSGDGGYQLRFHHLATVATGGSLSHRLGSRVFAFLFGRDGHLIDDASYATDAVDGIDDWSSLVLGGDNSSYRDHSISNNGADFATAPPLFCASFMVTWRVNWLSGTLFPVDIRGSPRSLEHRTEAQSQ